MRGGQFPEANAGGKCKSSVRIRYEQFRYFLKYRELNRFYFLYGFQHKTEKEQEEYLPYPVFRRQRNMMNLHNIAFVDRAESFNYIVLLRDKFYFGQILNSLGFNTPNNLFLIYGGSETFFVIRTQESLDLRHIVNYDFDAYCKIAIGECGVDVFHLSVSDGLIRINDKIVSLDEFRSMIGAGVFLVQEVVSQHNALHALYPLSVNTLRIITCKDQDGRYCLLDACLRIGAHGNRVDNWARGGLIVGIDDDGRLKRQGFYEFEINGKLCEMEHPDTHVVFDGYKIPFYKEAVDSAVRLHQMFYGIGTIGWDVAITADGPCFIEGNDNYEISLNQVANGGLRRKWNEIFG